MKKLFILFFIALSGCATTHNYEENLQSLIGTDVNNLISSWGAPGSVYKLPNGKDTLYSWTNNGGAVAMNMNNAPNSTFSTSLAAIVPRYCTTNFTVNEQNIITSWSHQGNRCKSK